MPLNLSTVIPTVLTCNIHFRSPTPDLASRGPGDALALELLLTEVFLDVVAGHVQGHLDVAKARLRVHELRLEAFVRGDRTIVALEEQLQRVHRLALQRRRFVLHGVAGDRLLQEYRQRNHLVDAIDAGRRDRMEA